MAGKPRFVIKNQDGSVWLHSPKKEFSKVNSWVSNHMKDGKFDGKPFPPKWTIENKLTAISCLHYHKMVIELEKVWEKENPLTLKEIAMARKDMKSYCLIKIERFEKLQDFIFKNKVNTTLQAGADVIDWVGPGKDGNLQFLKNLCESELGREVSIDELATAHFARGYTVEVILDNKSPEGYSYLIVGELF